MPGAVYHGLVSCVRHDIHKLTTAWNVISGTLSLSLLAYHLSCFLGPRFWTLHFATRHDSGLINRPSAFTACSHAAVYVGSRDHCRREYQIGPRKLVIPNFISPLLGEPGFALFTWPRLKASPPTKCKASIYEGSRLADMH